MPDASPRSDRASAAFWATSGVLVVVTMVTVALAQVLHQRLGSETVRAHSVLVVVATSGLFLVSATLRWAAYLVDGRADAKVRAAASAVVAVVLMPVLLWSHAPTDVGSDPEHLAVMGAGRVLAAVLVVTMLALAMTPPRWHERLYVVAGAAWLLALALLSLGLVAMLHPQGMVPLLSALALLNGALWGAVAGYAAHRTETRPWARTMAPLLLLMGITEVLVALDPRAGGPGSTASLLLVAALAGLAVARALRDLRGALADEQRRTADLERDLLATRDDLVVLQQRERRLAHDARGTLAGVRAAMQIWAGTTRAVDDGRVPGTDALRSAALQEVARLEDALREHRVQLGSGPVSLDLVVDRAVRVASARGAEIKVDVPGLVVLGQATDLELAVRKVIDRCLLADPSLRLEVSAERSAGAAVLLVRAPAGGFDDVEDLVHAAQLLRRSGGELHHDERDDVLRLVVPLCPTPRIVPSQRGPGRPPGQVRVPRPAAVAG